MRPGGGLDNTGPLAYKEPTMTIAPLRRSAVSLSLAALATGLVSTAAQGAAATRIDA